MFEFSFVRHYLKPGKGRLSVSLIALLSMAVISLVVWLVLVFLSVTEGIEASWLHKVAALNAPVRLQPTSAYFNSYYHQIDRYSSASNYLSKTIGQKAASLLSDPYNLEFDAEIPLRVAKPELDLKGELKDPVKEAYASLIELVQEDGAISFQDMEMSGALLKLDLIRQEERGEDPSIYHSQLTHVSYLSSFPDRSPMLKELILPPSIDDFNHLLLLSQTSQESFELELSSLFAHARIEELQPRSSLWKMDKLILPENLPFSVHVRFREKGSVHLLIPTDLDKGGFINGQPPATCQRRGEALYLRQGDGLEERLSEDVSLFAYGELPLKVKGIRLGYPLASSEKIVPEFHIQGVLQGAPLIGRVPFDGLLITKAKGETIFDTLPSPPPLWPFFVKEKGGFLPEPKKRRGVVVPKQFRENGVKMGDIGHLSYNSSPSAIAQQMEIPIQVSGFYDPGILAVGNRCLLVPQEITQAINASEGAFTLEPTESNALFVWFPKLEKATEIKEVVIEKLQKRGVDRYWNVQTFREYSFAKDLLLQFQSDKYLFTLVGAILLLVASTNIVSLLVVLVSDKKKEIGTLRAMGSKKRSILLIFALTGGSIGICSSLLGIGLAHLTLSHIDQLARFLSILQGHEAFNPQFFGQSLPNTLSPRALLFAGIATPVLAILAGLFPAIKAAKLNPTAVLRSE